MIRCYRSLERGIVITGARSACRLSPPEQPRRSLEGLGTCAGPRCRRAIMACWPGPTGGPGPGAGPPLDPGSESELEIPPDARALGTFSQSRPNRGGGGLSALGTGTGRSVEVPRRVTAASDCQCLWPGIAVRVSWSGASLLAAPGPGRPARRAGAGYYPMSGEHHRHGPGVRRDSDSSEL
jgi:hypothetical protein